SFAVLLEPLLGGVEGLGGSLGSSGFLFGAGNLLLGLRLRGDDLGAGPREARLVGGLRTVGVCLPPSRLGPDAGLFGPPIALDALDRSLLGRLRRHATLLDAVGLLRGGHLGLALGLGGFGLESGCV